MGFLRFIDLGRTLVLAALLDLSLAGTVNLPSYPLAVKSPYLSTWLPGSYIGDVATGQPEFWAGQDLTWSVLARVNGVSYTLFGAPSSISNTTAATTSGVSYSASHTIFNLTAGSTDFVLDFFSPVLPGTGSYARQSLPYSYLTVTATGSSKADVQILSAIDDTWTAQEGAVGLNFTNASTAGYFTFHNPNEILFTEDNDMATWGSVLFATTTGTAVTYACDTASTVYAAFTSTGSLTASSSCSGTDLAALSKDLGSTSSGSVTFAVGFDRPQAINYLGESQTGYYRTQWPTVSEAVSYFLSDYDSVLSTSSSFDSEVRSKSEAVSSEFGSQYADIVEASIRQTFGALELTVPLSDTSTTPSVFLKEISSDGNVNTVDVIYQTWPIFISLNPDYIKYLFEPILSYLASGRWPKAYVIHDIGSSYPNATGHDNGVEEELPLFETSTLFIMLYAYQKYTGDTSYAQQYLGLLRSWADYLVDNSLYPASQLISVDAIAASANQTALAIQCTIGLQAASILTGNSNYSTYASSFAHTLYNDALGLNGATLAESTHFTYNYGKPSTWNVLFAAYSDVLLDLNTFDSAAWDLQSDWYLSVIQAEGLPFAGPVNDTDYIGSPLEWGLTDWNIVASGASSTEVQQAVVNTTHTFMTNGLNTIPFGTKYYVEGSDVGVWIGNRARSTVGSHLALLAKASGTWGTSY